MSHFEEEPDRYELAAFRACYASSVQARETYVRVRHDAFILADQVLRLYALVTLAAADVLRCRTAVGRQRARRMEHLLANWANLAAADVAVLKGVA
jgi:hypothetical protein